MNDSIIMAVVGALIAGAVGLLFYFVKKYFERGDKERDQFKDDAKELTKEIGELKSAHTTQATALDKISLQLKTINDLMIDQIKEQGKVEGRLDEHISMIANYIQTIGHMSRQMEAIFRFIDAKDRPTDTSKVS